MNPIRLALMTEKTSYRTDVPSTGIPEWRWEDACHALAAGGATEVETAALEYRWRQARGCRHILYGALMLEALDIVRRHRWSDRFDGKRYIDSMVQLALDVEAMPQIDGVRPIIVPQDGGYKKLAGWWCLRLPWMSEQDWDKRGEDRYTAIRKPLDIWCGEAIRKAWRHLREEDEEND